MNQFWAILAVFRLQLKQTLTSSGSVGFLISAVPMAAAIAWIVRQSGESMMLTYVSVGIPLMWISNGMIFNVGWSLTSEINNGTVEFAISSRTSMMMIFIGKTLAQLISASIGGILALATVLLVTQQLPRCSIKRVYLSHRPATTHAHSDSPLSTYIVGDEYCLAIHPGRGIMAMDC
jgi:hypothetical protein